MLSPSESKSVMSRITNVVTRAMIPKSGRTLRATIQMRVGRRISERIGR
jgi:hypothetical protein